MMTDYQMPALENEQRKELIERYKSRISHIHGNCDYRIYSDEILLLKIALAALTAEPKAWFTDDAESDKSATTYSKEMAQRWRDKSWFVGELFTTPPAPVIKQEGEKRD